MPVTFQALGSTLTVSLHDENFAVVESFLRSGMNRDDLTGQFDRYHVLRYSGGRLMSSTLFAQRPRVIENSVDLTLDLTYRPAADNWDTYGSPPERAMELLGSPGPSFYFDWQEDGIDEAANLTPLTGWPPSGWPFARYPASKCFSPWLTVMGATLRAYVDQPCVARISATAFGAVGFTQVGRATENYQGVPYGPNWAASLCNNRELHITRFSLIVDSNPRLSEEFVNANQNIVDPLTGSMADYVSWVNVTEKAFFASQRENFKLMGEIALAGNGHYNFSFKYRGGGIDGWADGDAPNKFWPSDFTDAQQRYGRWQETEYGLPNEPATRAGWFLAANTSVFDGMGFPDLSVTYAAIYERPYVVAWENAAIHVEFFYNRKTAYVTDSADAEFFIVE